MKVKKGREPFVPIQVTLETQEEVDKLFALANHSIINKNLQLDGWWEKLDMYRSGEYEKWHSVLQSILKRK